MGKSNYQRTAIFSMVLFWSSFLGDQRQQHVALGCSEILTFVDGRYFCSENKRSEVEAQMMAGYQCVLEHLEAGSAARRDRSLRIGASQQRKISRVCPPICQACDCAGCGGGLWCYGCAGCTTRDLAVVEEEGEEEGEKEENVLAHDSTTPDHQEPIADEISQEHNTSEQTTTTFVPLHDPIGDEDWAAMGFRDVDFPDCKFAHNGEEPDACRANIRYLASEDNATIDDDQVAVTGFTLVDTTTNTDLYSLRQDSVINLYELPNWHLSMRADTNRKAGSVVFDMDFKKRHQVENYSPYALSGNHGKQYHREVELITRGRHTLTATPYSERGGNGEAGIPFVLHFIVKYEET